MPRVSQITSRAFGILGVYVNAVQIPDVIDQMEQWIAKGRACHSIVFSTLHGIAEANKDSEYKNIVNCADLVVADGMPLVWLGRLHGHSMRRRVYGPEVLEAFCRDTGSAYRHFFYGGAPGVAAKLAARLEKTFHIVVAGTCSPPFRELTAEEDTSLVQQVHNAAPDVLWVGLGAPKQERWMHEHRLRLRVPVLLGVGAAFDYHSGRIWQAPKWMRENGLEWFFRLLMEPRRLGTRYLMKVPRAIWSISMEMLQVRKSD